MEKVTPPTKNEPNRFIRTALTLFMAAGCLGAAADTSVTGIRIEGLPCVADIVTGTYYSTLPTTTTFPATVDVEFDVSDYVSLSLDGQTCTDGSSSVTVDSFDDSHTLTLTKSDGETLEYGLVFTYLPLVSLDDVPETVDRTKQDCQFSLIATASSTFDGEADEITQKATIKIRGASSTVYPKKSYGIEIVDDEGEELDCPLLGLREDGDWILEALYTDYSKMRKQLCFDLWLDQCDSPVEDAKYPNGIRGRHVEVFINGSWHGLYILSEKVDRKQLGIKKVKEDDDTGEVTLRGISFKGESWSDATHLDGYDATARTDTLEWQGWSQDYPDDEGTYAWDYLKSIIDFTSQSSSLDDATFCEQAEQWFDMDNVIDYLLFLQLTDAVDNCLKNTFLSIYNVQEDDSRWFFTPWDLDATFGRMPGGDESNVYGFDYNYMVPSFFRRLLTSPYADQLRERWNELKETVWAPASVNARIEEYANLLVESGAWERERKQWPAFCNDAESEVEFMETWYSRNYQVVDSVLNQSATDIQAIDATGETSISLSGNTLTVNASNDSPSHLDIYDIGGRHISSAEIKGRQTLTLTAGVYVVSLNSASSNLRKKIVVY